MSFSLASNTTLLTLAQLVRVAAQAVFIIWIRGYLGPVEFGNFSVAFVLAKLLTQLAELGFPLTVLRDASAQRHRLGEVLSGALGLRAICSLGVILLLVVSSSVLPYPRAVAWATVLFGISYLLQSFSQLFFASLRSVEKVQFEPLSLGIYAIILLGGTAWAVSRGGTLVSIAWVTVAAQGAGFTSIIVSALTRLPTAVRLRFDTRLIRDFWRSGWPIGIGTIGYLIYYQSDTLLLYFIRGKAETGYYNTAYQLVAVTLILPVSYYAALLPRLTQRLSRSREDAAPLLALSSRLMMAVGIPLAIGTVVIAPGLLAMLFPDAAVESVLPLRILIWMAALSYWGQAFTNTAVIVEGARIYMRLSILGAVVNTVANLLVIPRYGYIGACWTTLGTEILINSLFYYLVRAQIFSVPLFPLVWKPLVASGVMVFALWLTSGLPLPVQVLLAMVVYGGCIVAMGELKTLRIAASELTRPGSSQDC